jgi:hypothetical protein
MEKVNFKNKKTKNSASIEDLRMVRVVIEIPMFADAIDLDNIGRELQDICDSCEFEEEIPNYVSVSQGPLAEEDLKNYYDFEMIDAKGNWYGIVGNKIIEI